MCGITGAIWRDTSAAISREVLDRNQYMDFFLLNESDFLNDVLTENTVEPFFIGELA